MLYVSNGSMRCFERGDIGHKRFVCLHKSQDSEEAGQSGAVTEKQVITEEGQNTLQGALKKGGEQSKIQQINIEQIDKEEREKKNSISVSEVQISKRKNVEV